MNKLKLTAEKLFVSGRQDIWVPQLSTMFRFGFGQELIKITIWVNKQFGIVMDKSCK